MFATRRISTPMVGKTEMAQARMRTAAGIISRNGARNVSMTQILGGHGAGTMHLYGFFDSMEHMMKVNLNVMADPAWAALMAERESNPSAEVVGPEASRLIAGQPKPANTTFLVREYILPRENMAAAIELIAEAQEMVSAHSMNVTMWAPVITADMQRFGVVYSAPDPVTLGKGMDQVGMSDAFQEMLVRASKLGTLDRSFGMRLMR